MERAHFHWAWAETKLSQRLSRAWDSRGFVSMQHFFVFLVPKLSCSSESKAMRLLFDDNKPNSSWRLSEIQTHIFQFFWPQLTVMVQVVKSFQTTLLKSHQACQVLGVHQDKKQRYFCLMNKNRILVDAISGIQTHHQIQLTSVNQDCCDTNASRRIFSNYLAQKPPSLPGSCHSISRKL